MKFNNSEPQSPFQNVTLKRNKDAFRMSTGMFSTAQATHRTNEGYQNVSKFDSRQSLNPKQQYERKSQRKNYAKIKLFRPQILKLQQTQMFKNLSSLINQEKQSNRSSVNFMQNRTHCYSSNGTLGHDFNPQYQITNQQKFPPSIVQQVYNQQMNKSPDGNVAYHFGNLQKSGYLYFCVEKTLILMNSLYYVSSQQRQNTIMIDVPQHAISVKQLIISDFQVQDIQRHPFGQKQTILLIWFQWSVGFYSLEPRGLVKLVDLNMRFETSCQAASLFDYCKNGNIYYMNQQGQMGKIQLFHKNFFSFWSWNKKFSMKQYFYKLKNETKRKHEKLLYTGFFQKLKQFYRDTKYWWATKRTKGKSIICDRQLDLLYTFVETSVQQHTAFNRIKTLSHRQIRMYGLLGKNIKLNFLQRIQSQMYMNPPKLLRQLTEENLYSQIGAHLFNNLSLQKFQVSGIHVPYSFTNSHLQYGKHRSNLLIVLKNGSRIYLYLSPDRLILNQMINLPNLENLISLQRRNQNLNKNYQPVTIAQRQPANFSLIRHKFNFKDRSLALVGVYRRILIHLLFSQTKQENNSVEEVEILWEVSLEQDEQGTPSKSIFINQSDYRLFLGPQFQNNLYKKKLSQYKYNQVEIISKISQEDNQKHKSKTEQIKNNTIKQNPLSRQILHYPQQFQFINKDKMRGVTKLRPIDLLLATLQKQISTHNQANINAMMFSDYQLNKLLTKIENNLKIKNTKIQRLQILVMFVQIYCDVDGVYYFDQFSLDNYGKRNSDQNEKRKSQNMRNYDETRKRTSQRLSNTFQNTFDQDQQRQNYQQRLKRYTQKFSKISSFRKYRYTDLVTAQNFDSSQRLDRSPLKQSRSDHSLMKLILKLAAYMMKSANTEKMREYFDEVTRQNQWIHYSTKSPNNFIASQQIQQAILTYMSRLLVPIWSLKIKSINNFIFPYLAQTCKKIIEYIRRVQYQLTMVSLSSNFQQLHDLCARTIQYNLLLSVLSNPPLLKYGDGMGSNRQIFQQAIFYSLQKQKDISKCVNQWRQILPNYFSTNLLKAITLQAQIMNINKIDQKKEIVLNNYKYMPHYLLYCYYRDGTLTKSQIQSLIQLNQSRKGQSSLRNVNHIVNAQSMDPLQKVKYAVAEIYKNSNSLQQKQFLIVYAKQNVSCIRNERSNQIQNIKKQVNRLQKVLKIQQLMLKQLQRYQDQHPGQKVDDKTKQLINNYLLSPTQIKKLIIQLKNPTIQLIYYCCFWDIDINIQSTLRQLMYDSHKRKRKSTEIRQILKQVFQMTSIDNNNKLPLAPLLGALDQLAFSQLNKVDLINVISRNDEKMMKQKLWVPLFLSDWIWNKSMMLDYYIEQAQKQFKSFESLETQRLFLYYWLSAYTLTKFKHVEGRRIFQVANQSILKLAEIRREDILQNQVKLLANFLKQKLAY